MPSTVLGAEYSPVKKVRHIDKNMCPHEVHTLIGEA